MGLDRLLERLREGAPPLRMHEVSEMTGYSVPFVRKLIHAGALRSVRMAGGVECRVPVLEARRVLVELEILQESKL